MNGNHERLWRERERERERESGQRKGETRRKIQEENAQKENLSFTGDALLRERKT